MNWKSGESLEYEWSTTTRFGGVLNDYNGKDGTEFTSTSEKVAFYSNASTLQLGDGENIEEVSVTCLPEEGKLKKQNWR